jgi:uncharacterized protein RhaS with RHS repeats
MRDYDPNVGRYVESDPIGLRSGVNTYAYAGGNAVSNIDPLGLASPSDEARAAGILPYGHPYGWHPSPYLPSGSKAKICSLLKNNNRNANFAWQAADKIRLGPWGDGVGTWRNVEDREVENWLSIIAWPNGPQSNADNINFYEGVVKQNFSWIYHTSPYNEEAWGAALEALNHKNQSAADLDKWCSCGN